MSGTIRVFISYSHKDARYLGDDSLLGFLKGLERESIEFWWDERISTGDLWDDEIKAGIEDSHIALALVSQAFLDSEYINNVELRGFLERKRILLPLILSPCEWDRHEWLRSRQFLPGGNESIERHYTHPGKRKELFLKYRKDLREKADKLRSVAQVNDKLQPRPTVHQPITHNSGLIC